MSDIFTVSKRSEGLYKEKGSKFISFLYPVTTEDEVKTIVEQLRIDHPKSRHVCYAFRLGAKAEIERANDDGEPNGSAGLPILNQLLSAELTNVGLFVVRYFGGTKLGLSGLIHAYKEASKEAIGKVRKVKYIEKFRCIIEFEISEIGKVEFLVNTGNYTIEKKEFGEKCVFELSCLLEESEELIEKLRVINSISIKG